MALKTPAMNVRTLGTSGKWLGVCCPPTLELSCWEFELSSILENGLRWSHLNVWTLLLRVWTLGISGVWLGICFFKRVLHFDCSSGEEFADHSRKGKLHLNEPKFCPNPWILPTLKTLHIQNWKSNSKCTNYKTIGQVETAVIRQDHTWIPAHEKIVTLPLNFG